MLLVSKALTGTDNSKSDLTLGTLGTPGILGTLFQFNISLNIC